MIKNIIKNFIFHLCIIIAHPGQGKWITGEFYATMHISKKFSSEFLLKVSSFDMDGKEVKKISSNSCTIKNQNVVCIPSSKCHACDAKNSGGISHLDIDMEIFNFYRSHPKCYLCNMPDPCGIVSFGLDMEIFNFHILEKILSDIKELLNNFHVLEKIMTKIDDMKKLLDNFRVLKKIIEKSDDIKDVLEKIMGKSNNIKELLNNFHVLEKIIGKKSDDAKELLGTFCGLIELEESTKKSNNDIKYIYLKKIIEKSSNTIRGLLDNLHILEKIIDKSNDIKDLLEKLPNKKKNEMCLIVAKTYIHTYKKSDPIIIWVSEEDYKFLLTSVDIYLKGSRKEILASQLKMQDILTKLTKANQANEKNDDNPVEIEDSTSTLLFYPQIVYTDLIYSSDTDGILSEYLKMQDMVTKSTKAVQTNKKNNNHPEIKDATSTLLFSPQIVYNTDLIDSSDTKYGKFYAAIHIAKKFSSVDIDMEIFNFHILEKIIEKSNDIKKLLDDIKELPNSFRALEKIIREESNNIKDILEKILNAARIKRHVLEKIEKTMEELNDMKKLLDNFRVLEKIIEKSDNIKDVLEKIIGKKSDDAKELLNNFHVLEKIIGKKSDDAKEILDSLRASKELEKRTGKINDKDIILLLLKKIIKESDYVKDVLTKIIEGSNDIKDLLEKLPNKKKNEMCLIVAKTYIHTYKKSDPIIIWVSEEDYKFLLTIDDKFPDEYYEEDSDESIEEYYEEDSDNRLSRDSQKKIFASQLKMQDKFLLTIDDKFPDEYYEEDSDESIEEYYEEDSDNRLSGDSQKKIFASQLKMQDIFTKLTKANQANEKNDDNPVEIKDATGTLLFYPQIVYTDLIDSSDKKYGEFCATMHIAKKSITEFLLWISSFDTDGKEVKEITSNLCTVQKKDFVDVPFPFLFLLRNGQYSIQNSCWSRSGGIDMEIFNFHILENIINKSNDIKKLLDNIKELLDNFPVLKKIIERSSDIKELLEKLKNLSSKKNNEMYFILTNTYTHFYKNSDPVITWLSEEDYKFLLTSNDRFSEQSQEKNVTNRFKMQDILMKATNSPFS